MLSRFSRWALGMYPPFTPAELRLTDVKPVEVGLSQLVSKVELTEADRAMLLEFQKLQHATREALQESMLAREIEEGK